MSFELIKTENVNNTIDPVAQLQQNLKMAVKLRHVYREIDRLIANGQPEDEAIVAVATQNNFDAKSIANLYNRRKQKQAEKQAEKAKQKQAKAKQATKPKVKPIPEPQAEEPLEPEPVNNTYNYTDSYASEGVYAEQLFVEPIEIMPTKNPVRLYNITDTPDDLLHGGGLCETIKFKPITKEYIKSKYGGGVYILRELLPDGREVLVRSKDNRPMGPIEIAMTLEEQAKRMIQKQQQIAQVKEAQSNQPSPINELTVNVLTKAVDKLTQPQPQPNPIESLNSILSVIDKIRPPQNTSAVEMKLYEQFEKMQQALLEAKEGIYKKEIEFLQQRLQDKIASKNPEGIKEIIVETLKEQGIKAVEEEKPSIFSKFIERILSSDYAVNKIVDIGQGLLFAVTKLANKEQPASVGALPQPNPQPQTQPQPQAQTQTQTQPNPEVKPQTQTLEDQEAYYKKLDKEQNEREILKLIKIVSMSTVPSDLQIEWILQGESIPFIFPQQINEINQLLAKAWEIQESHDMNRKDELADILNKIRAVFTKFPAPLDMLFASEKGKAFIEGFINNYVMIKEE